MAHLHTKPCPRCGQRQDLSMFHKCSGKSDGLQVWCKACKAITEKERRLAQPERFAQRKLRYVQSDRGRLVVLIGREAYGDSETAKIKRSVSQGRYRSNNQRDVKVRKTLQDAARRGHVLRPTTCSICHNIDMETGVIKGHHLSYAPGFELAVIWCCSPCHRMIHSYDAP